MSESRRTTVSELAKMLAERKAGGTSSVTLKTSAQGKFMPELTVAAGASDEEIDLMIVQAVNGYRRLLAAEPTPDFDTLIAEGGAV